jgi:hypothetical protein
LVQSYNGDEHRPILSKSQATAGFRRKCASFLVVLRQSTLYGGWEEGERHDGMGDGRNGKEIINWRSGGRVKERMKWRLGGRGKQGWNGGSEEGERKDGIIEVERKAKERIKWRLGGSGKKGWNGGCELEERKNQMEVGGRGEKG